jgi:hypothetical protein
MDNREYLEATMNNFEYYTDFPGGHTSQVWRYDRVRNQVTFIEVGLKRRTTSVVPGDLLRDGRALQVPTEDVPEWAL